jgi:hypothetical protein
VVNQNVEGQIETADADITISVIDENENPVEPTVVVSNRSIEIKVPAGGETLLERSLTLTLNGSQFSSFILSLRRADRQFGEPILTDGRYTPLDFNITQYTLTNTIGLLIPDGLYYIGLINNDDEIFDDGKSYRATVNIPGVDGIIYVNSNGNDQAFFSGQLVPFDWNLNITQ